MNAAVLFDFDGTLLNDVDLHARAWLAALEQEAGLSPPYLRVRQVLGLYGESLASVLLPPDVAASLGPVVAHRAQALFRESFHARARPFMHVRELFERLQKAGVQRVVVSAQAHTETAPGLVRAGVDTLVDLCLDADTVPPRERYVAAVQRLGGPGPRLVAVGDSPLDLQLASEAGLTTVGLLSGGYNAAELRQAGCSALYEDCADLLARFGSWQPVLRLPYRPPVPTPAAGVARL